MNFLFRNTGKTPLEIKQEETETKRLQGNIDNVNVILETASNLLPQNNQYNYNTLVNSYSVNYASNKLSGILSSDSYSYFSNKQDKLILTTNGSSGAATLIGRVLNIPQYSGGGGISTLNTLTASTQTFATGTSGSDFNISSSTSTHTFNIPDASATARGLVTTGTQTLAGDKTFSSAPTFSTMTAGSVLFAGTSGLLSQDNTNLFWDNTNKRLGIGTNAPGQTLRVVGDTSFARTITTASGTGGVSSFQTIISPTVNSTGSHRGLFIATNHSAAGINFTGFNTASAWIENRPFNVGTIQQLNGFITSGLVLASNTISCGTVSEVIAGRFLAVNQFSNTLTTAITTSIALLVDNNIKTNATITNSIGAVFNAMTTGTNNTNLLIGTAIPVSGNWSIHDASGYNNYISGKLFIGTTTDAGYKLDVNGIARVVTSLDTPLVRGSSSIASGTLTLSSTGSGTKGRIIFGSSTYFFDEVNNCLKLGNVLPPTDSPAIRLQISNESSNSTIANTAFTNTAAESGGINFARYRGTAASPLAVQSGDRLGLVVSLGYDGSARQASAAVLFSCDGAVSSGVVPGAVELQTGTSGAGRTTRLTISSAGNFTYFDGGNFILGTTTGTKIGTATSQKLSFWNATPIVQPTTAVAAATRVGGGGTTVTDTDTFDGYTIAQIVKALRNTGLLA